MRNKTTVILRSALFVGVLYFLGVSIAHLFGIKVPFLFIYYNVPSTVYQDRIISILSFGWAVFFFFALADTDHTKAFLKPILCAGGAALLGIAFINVTTDFHSLSPDSTPLAYWGQWLVLVIYFGLLAGAYLYSKK